MTLTRKSPGLAWIGLAALTVCSLDARTADAQTPDCSTITFTNPIYGIGGSAARPLIGSFAAAFRGDANPITIVWSDPGACFAMSALVGPTGTPVNITGTARYWDADGTEHQCIHSGAGVPADFGYMAAQPQACAGYEGGIPATIGNFVGPVTGWALITHLDSNQSSISSEAAYLAYGFGDDSQADPWDQEAFLFRRNATSAALLAISAATTLPPANFLGTDVMTNANMITSVSTATDANAALGFVSVELAGPNGEIVDARRPTGAGSGPVTAEDLANPEFPRFSRNALANCVSDGFLREDVVFQEDPSEGSWDVFVNLFDSCGQPAVTYVVEIYHRVDHGDGTYSLELTDEYSGQLLDLHANGGTELGTYLTTLTFP